MPQSLNTKAELATDGISYLGMGAKYGKLLVGDKAFEFFNDKNVQDFIQIPWQEVTEVYAQVSGRNVGRRFRVVTTAGTFDFSSKDAGKILKVMRHYLGDDKVLRMPSLWKKLFTRFKK
jgi:hypothetical protein